MPRVGKNIAANFPVTSSQSKLAISNIDPSNVEIEYIKNLQQQIYFLELEVSFLRELAKKTSDLHPAMTVEAEKMLLKLRELQTEVDHLRSELRKKDSLLEVAEAEKSKFHDKLRHLDDEKSRSKRVMVEELIDMKKQIETLKKDLTSRDIEIRDLQSELEEKDVVVRNFENKLKDAQKQIHYSEEHHNKMLMQLEDKKVDALRKESALKELEDKYYSSTASVQEATIKGFREEIRILKQRLKETEMNADHDRYLRSKMADDKGSLIRENAALGSQVVELQKQLDMERALKEKQEIKRTAEISELVTLRDKEKELQDKTTHLSFLLDEERTKSERFIGEVSKLEQLSSSQTVKQSSLKSKLSDVENRRMVTEKEMERVKKDKTVLTDHVSELQEKLRQKDDHILRLKAELHSMQTRINSLEEDSHMHRSLQSQKWEEFERLAESMKNLSRSMSVKAATAAAKDKHFI